MLAIKNWQGETIGEVAFSLTVAKPHTAKDLVYRALVRQLANARQGTASTKTRAEVRGGGRKPWRQKGTGRARAGSTRSPLWRGGGVIFGPKPRDYSINMNKKERRLALRTALMSRVADFVVVTDFSEHLPQPKTRELAAALQRWGLAPKQKALMILHDTPEPVILSARNIANLVSLRANQLNIFDILNADKIVITVPSLEVIKQTYEPRKEVANG
ncbi:MAG: 50S ribosomal protein L4 [Pseudanabaenaceae cyanobacterium]